MRRTLISSAMIVVAALAITGCSTEVAPASSDSGAVVDITEYQTAAEKALEPITEFTGPTEGPAAKKGAKVMLLACGFAAEGCKGPADAAPEAAKILGWDLTVIDGQFDPQIYNRSISQAIDQGYDAIMLGSIAASAIAESLKKARAAGIVIGSWDGGNEATEGGVNFEVDQPLAQQGINVANYMVWKSGGKAKALILRNPEFNVVTAWSDSAAKVFNDCASCEVVRQDQFTAGDAATRLPTLVTQALRENSSINTVLGGYDAALLTTIPAVEAAGLEEQARVAGFNGISPFIEFIRNGRASVTSAVPLKWGMWAGFDNINRILQGEDAVDQRVPTRIIAEENIGDIPPNSQWEGDVDYKAAFEKIWAGQG